MDVEIYKVPRFENDEVLFKLINWRNVDVKALCEEDAYLKEKVNKFNLYNTSMLGFEPFKDRPSLRGYDSSTILVSSIYTAAVERMNNIPHSELLDKIKESLKYDSNNRRVVVRFLNSFDEYMAPRDKKLDVSCLAFIQYIKLDGKLNVKICYRASDIKNELWYDIITIYNSFVHPVDQRAVDMTFYSSTSQNITSFNTTLLKLREVQTKYAGQ